jgi:GTPase SAR1 family protein
VQNPIAVPEVTITSSLEGLQTEEQSHVLDIITQLRKCGLDSVLQLPQIVVCGDQSAGKSSVLEALTEIPFPRSDNLCTRYATEIILRRAVTDSLTIKVIPDDDRSTAEKESISSFKAVITNFDDLPEIMAKAMSVMGIESDLSSGSISRAFAKDVLSIEIEGPTRPQLTLVDLPGLIQTDTRGVTKADVQLVAEITDRYIGQSRTICLAVIAATNDYANQGILTKVRNVDPKGERTLGIITKPDRLIPGSGMEKAYFDLARNEDVHFTLGWHVLKNRAFEESSNSFMERNASEAAYFRKSIFKVLPKQDVGIDSLRDRLSKLLFHHVQLELPKLQEDLQEALTETKTQLKILGASRSTPQECKEYLTQLSLDFYEICKAAASGHYEGDYFTSDVDKVFSVNSPATRRRLRAVIQFMNSEFAENFRKTGHKYHIDMPMVFQGALPNGGPLDKEVSLKKTGFTAEEGDNTSSRKTAPPINKTASEALEWVSQVLIRTRGKELAGNFNPLLVGELFWEQSSKWPSMAMDYVDEIADVCTQFLKDLLLKKCPKDIHPRLWSSVLQDSVNKRYEAALHELELLREDLESYPINYNHYYIDNITKTKMKRYEASLSKSIEGATQHNPVPGCSSQSHTSASIDIAAAINRLFRSTDPNMDKRSCEDALDCLLSIYKVCPQNTP